MGRKSVYMAVFGGLLAFSMFVAFAKGPAGAWAVDESRRVGMGGDVEVIPIQLGRDSYGLAMIDRSLETLWIYEIDTRASAAKRLALVAARTYKYDRQLTSFNSGSPSAEQIRAVLARERNRAEESIWEVAEPNK